MIGSHGLYLYRIKYPERSHEVTRGHITSDQRAQCPITSEYVQCSSIYLISPYILSFKKLDRGIFKTMFPCTFLRFFESIIYLHTLFQAPKLSRYNGFLLITCYIPNKIIAVILAPSYFSRQTGLNDTRQDLKSSNGHTDLRSWSRPT